MPRSTYVDSPEAAAERVRRSRLRQGLPEELPADRARIIARYFWTGELIG